MNQPCPHQLCGDENPPNSANVAFAESSDAKQNVKPYDASTVHGMSYWFDVNRLSVTQEAFSVPWSDDAYYQVHIGGAGSRCAAYEYTQAKEDTNCQMNWKNTDTIPKEIDFIITPELTGEIGVYGSSIFRFKCISTIIN